MRFLIKNILLICLLIVPCFANTPNIDECKNDLYFANGILIKHSKVKAKENWENSIGTILSTNPETLKQIGKVDIAYNVSEGFFSDIYESINQKMSSEWGWTEYSQEYKEYVDENNIDDINNYHVKDLIKQINAYKESIKLGHSIIVVAHSQGTLYTNEAYDALDNWMKDYFHMMGVATPADHVSGGGPHVTFHNDIINLVPNSLSSNREDTNNEHNSVISYDAHDFYESYMKEETTKSDIQNFIISKINEHKNAPSQWVKDQEFDKGTKDYKITVKHLYDPNNISIGDTKIYPFNTTKKLYKVIDNTGGNGWVKASCGGSEVVNKWDNKNTEDDYKLKGTDEIISHNIIISETKVRKAIIGYSIDECSPIFEGCPIITHRMSSDGDFLAVWFYTSTGIGKLYKSQYVPNDDPRPSGFASDWIISAMGEAKGVLSEGIDTNNIINYKENIYMFNGPEKGISEASIELYYK